MSYLPRELGNSRTWIGVPSSYYRSPHIPPEFRMPEAGPKIFQRPVRETFTQVVRKPKKLVPPKPLQPSGCPPCQCPICRYPNSLGQWEAVATIATQAIPFFKGIFGGNGKKRRAKKTSAAHAGGQQILGSITNLPILIDKIEKFLNGHTKWFDCPLGATSTPARSCWVAACQAAKKLGWTATGVGSYKGKPFPGCQPYDVEFDSAKLSLINFFENRLPELKAELARQQAPSPLPAQVRPVTPYAPEQLFPTRSIPTLLRPMPTMPITTPYPFTTPYLPTQPRIITLPGSALPTIYEEPAPAQQMDINPMLVVGGLGLLALIMMR